MFDKLQALVSDVMKASFAPGAGGRKAIGAASSGGGSVGGGGGDDEDEYGMGLFDDAGSEGGGVKSDKAEKQLYWFDLKVR